MFTPVNILPANAEAITEAVKLLKTGRLVAFPTETVYGLGADATQDHAVAAIYAAKGRPQFNPLIIHVAEISGLNKLILWNDTARLLAEKFWPGPITLVLPRNKEASVSLLASAGMDSLAVRIPSHPIARLLLQEVDRPIAAPSANTSGKLSPTRPEHVIESLKNKVDLILDGGSCMVGVESTVVDLTTDIPTILRPGGITKEQIESIVGHTAVASHDHKIVSPGMSASHYAPNISLRLNAESVDLDEALLAFGDASKIIGGALRLNLSANGNLKEAAANLFSMLRELDRPDLRGIAVMPIPNNGLGIAINDRLYRASLNDKS